MARRSRKSSIGKKIMWTVFGIVIALVVIVGGVSAKVYFDVKGAADKTYHAVERKNKIDPTRDVEVTEGDPFSILLMGIDTGDLGRIDQGRSDSMMFVAVNPRKESTRIVSLERDTYTEIVEHGTEDKLNHAYAFGGPAMSMDTVEKLLNVPIDHYISIDMAGIQTIVDEIGGIEVNNTLEFTYEGSTFNYGKIELNGEEALKYSRMRYDDPRGDYGRQERQRKVIAAIADKAIDINNVTRYKSILDSLGDTIQTDLSFDEMVSLAQKYRESFRKIEMDQLQGEGFMKDGVSYQEVSQAERDRVKKELDKQLDIMN